VTTLAETYTWGNRPKCTVGAQVGKTYDFKNQELGIIQGLTFQQKDLSLTPTLNMADAAKAFREEMTKKGATVIYLRMHGDTNMVLFFETKTIVIDECIFRGNGIAPAVIAAIVIVVAISAAVIVSFLVLTPGIFYKAANVSPDEAIKYNLGQIPVMLLAVVIVAAITIVIVAWKAPSVLRTFIKRRKYY